MTILRKKYVVALGLLVTMMVVGTIWGHRFVFKQGAAGKRAPDRPASELPSSLNEAIQTARYNVRAGAEGSNAIEAHNPAQRLRAYFTKDQVQVQPADDCQQPWQLALKLKGYGYGAQVQEVGEGSVRAKDNRVEITRSIKPNSGQRATDNGQVIEWYTNTPKGIEQGFILNERPTARSSSLRVVMEMRGGWNATPDADGQAVTLQNSSTTLRYDQLHTFDATGRELASRMEINGTELALVVNDENAIWPLTIDPTLSQQTQFVANNGAAYDQFGYSVAISGETAIVGVPDNDAGGTVNRGAAYVFVRNGSTWSQQAQLLANDAASSDAFGWSVAISGDTAVVGAYTDDVGSNGDQGSAYVFVRSGTTWSQQAKLTASDGATNDWFGYAVAMSGDIAVIGAPLSDATYTTNQGAAYVFVRSSTTWTQETRLSASDAADNDNFGFSVALNNDTTVVGSPSDDVNGNGDQGSAYVFVRSGTTWSQQQQLAAGNGASSDQFGYSVALSNNTAVIGAPLDDVGANGDQGSAYVFVRSGTTWSQQQQLTAGNGASSDQFGGSVTISNDMAAIGAPTDDVGSNSDQGSAYVFTRYDTLWTQQQQLIASGGAAYDNLGWAIAISGYTVVVGSPTDDVGGNTDQGSAYVFSPTCPSITLSPTTLANGTQNLAYPSTQITPSSGTPPFTYEISSGALPSGLTLSSSGVLSGTPTVAGNFNFTVKITDINLCYGSRAYSLTIASCAPPSVTKQPTDQTSQVAGSATFTADAGGTPPTVQWQVSTDNGNNWANLNGETNKTLSLTNLAVTMNGNKYRAVFTNACGTATSDAATLTVNKLTPTVALNSSSSTVTYGQSVTLTATVSGAVAATGTVTFKNGATTLGASALSNGLATFTSSTLSTDTYAIKAEYGGDANYVGNTSSALTQTVNKAMLTVTAENKARAYGAANPDLTVTITGFVNGDASSVVSGAASLATTATQASNVGDYPITSAQGTLAAANYNFTFVNGTLTVNKGVLTVTADNKSRSYGAENPILSATITGFINGETNSVVSGAAALSTTATASSAAGAYPILVSQGTLAAANYDFTFSSGTLTVGKATLTVTAENKSRSYGTANPSLTAVITGFVNGETDSVVSGEAALSTTATISSVVGSYPITPMQGTLAAANYDFVFLPGTLTIGKAVLTVTAENKVRSYGAANPAFTTIITGFVNGETSNVVMGEANLSTIATQSSAAGTYPITVTQGTLTATNYDFTFVNGTLTVGKALLTITADNKSRSYGAVNPAFTTTITGFVNGDSTSSVSGEAALSTTAAPSSGVGAYPITITQGTLVAANYDFTFVNGTLTVGKAALTVTAENKSRAYGAANPALTFRYAGFVNNDNESALTGAPEITTAAVPGSPIGAYPISVKPGTLDTANYQLTFVDGTLTIGKAALGAAAENATRGYGAANPTLTGKLTGVQNNDKITASFTTAATTASAVGTYDITPVLNDPDNKLGNYEVTLTNGTLTVTQAVLTVTAENKSRAYGAANPELTATISGFVNGETNSVLGGTLQLNTTATVASPVGTYSITASGLTSSNYAINFVAGTLTISKAMLTVTAEDKAKTYGASNPELTATIAGFVNNDSASVLSGNASLTTTATEGSGVGAYPINVQQGTLTAANYDFNFIPGKLTVGKATLTVTAENKSRTYGTANPPFTATLTGFINGDTTSVVSGEASLNTTATEISAVNTYPITVTQGTLAAANYDFIFVNGALTVTKALLTVTADNQSRAYGSANPSLTATLTGFVNGDSISSVSGEAALSTTAAPSSGVGAYPITITQGTLAAANYDFTFVNGELTITKATLTVTADDKARTYGAANPDLTATMTGFVNGETRSVVSGEAVMSTTATSGNAVGAYPITVAQGTLTAANYSFAFVNGTLTINKAMLTVTADNKSRTYGAANPNMTATMTGFVNGETGSVVTGEAALSTTATASSAAGTYPITVTQGTLTATNYDFTFVNGTLTVGKATLTVTAENKSKVFGAALPELTFSYTGFVNGDSASVVTGAPSLATTAAANSSVGQYPISISAGTLAAESYDFVFVIGALTITSADTTVALVSNAPSALVGQSVTFTAIITPVAPGEGVPTGSVTFKNGATTLGTVELNNGQAALTTDQLALGTHAITAVYSGADNFNASTSQTLSQAIGKSTSTVTLASALDTVRYGQSVTLTASVTGTGATPTGKVNFMNGSSSLGTVALANGTASLTVDVLPVGVHSITASYEGDSQNEGGTSRSFSLTVNKAQPTLNIASSANPAALKQFITLASNLANVAPGVSLPTGTIVFKDGSTVLGTATIDRLGRASVSTNQLTAGAHTITAEFSGDGNYEASQTAAFTQTVGKGLTAMRLTSSAKTTTYSQAVNFTAAVYSAGDTPTGIVEFYDGTTRLGEASLYGGSAIFNTTALSNGEHSIRAVYKGEDRFVGCQSAVLKHTVSTFCTWNLSTTNLSYTPQGGWGQIPVDSLTDCYWYAYTNNSWITIHDFGPEVGAVSFTVAPLTNGTSRTGTIFVADKRVTIVQSKFTESVSGASYQKGGIAANSIVSVFGDGMAAGTELAQAVPLPTTLANTRVKITDRAGVEHFAPLFYVSPLQINYQVPADVGEGTALVTILNEAGEITGSGLIEIAPISPAVFSANSNGRDVASAFIQRVRLDGSQSYEQIAQYDPAQGKVVPIPIDFGEEGEELYLALFGTGVRSRIDLLAVRVLVNDEEAEVVYADVQGYFVGVDQINLKLPRKLAGKGDVDVKVMIEGKVANTVRINLR